MKKEEKNGWGEVCKIILYFVMGVGLLYVVYFFGVSSVKCESFDDVEVGCNTECEYNTEDIHFKGPCGIVAEFVEIEEGQRRLDREIEEKYDEFYGNMEKECGDYVGHMLLGMR